MGVRTWPPEDEKIVREKWGFHSAAVIARHFLQGRYSRNAVLGKSHRMGLKGALQTTDPLAPPPKARVMSTKPKLVVVPPIPEPVPLLIDGKRITLMELGRGMCKWPISHMNDPEMHFCGRADDGKGPYCEHHHRKGVQPQTGKSQIDPDVRRRSGIDKAFG